VYDITAGDLIWAESERRGTGGGGSAGIRDMAFFLKNDAFMTIKMTRFNFRKQPDPGKKG
jgi:hypothetical protein